MKSKSAKTYFRSFSIHMVVGGLDTQTFLIREEANFIRLEGP